MCLYEYNQEAHMKFVREEGIEQGNLTAIRNLMKNMDWSVVEAMKAIGIPNEKWQEYEKKLYRKADPVCRIVWYIGSAFICPGLYSVVR